MNKLHCLLQVIIFLILPLVSEANDLSFSYNDKAIHPYIVKEFLPLISDKNSSVNSIDITTASGSNEYYDGDVSVNERGITEVRTSDSSFGYRVLGCVGNDVYVLRTYDWGGGSGVFQDLLFVNFDNCMFYNDKGRVEYHKCLKLVWRMVLGDRFDGDVIVKSEEVVIDGDKILLPFMKSKQNGIDAKRYKVSGESLLEESFHEHIRQMIRILLKQYFDELLEKKKITSSQQKKLMTACSIQFLQNESRYLREFDELLRSVFSNADLIRLGQLHQKEISIISPYTSSDEFDEARWLIFGKIRNEIIQEAITTITK